MKLYWFSRQVPELKDLPWEEREEIVEDGIFSIPLTLRNLSVVCGFLIPLTTLGVLLTMFVWEGTVCLWFPLAVLGLHVLFLNLARSQMRELVQARESTLREGDPDS
jgi:hypothetical protein